HEHVDAVPEEIDRLLDEGAQGGAATLVARGDNLDDADHPTEGVANCDAIGSRCRDILLRTDDVSGFRRRRGDDAAGGWYRGWAWPRPALPGKGVGHEATPVLLDPGRGASGQQSPVEGVAESNRPRLMEVVEQVGVDARPVVDRHGKSSQCPSTAYGLFYHPLGPPPSEAHRKVLGHRVTSSPRPVSPAGS